MSQTLQELACEIRVVNAANGWGKNWKLRDLGEFLHLVQTEVTEAYRAVPHDRPEEFADIIIRCLDICELIGTGLVGQLAPHGLNDAELMSAEVHVIAEIPSRAYMQLHTALTDAHEIYRKQYRSKSQIHLLRIALVSQLLVVIGVTVAFNRVFGGPDLEPVLLAKLEKNRTRGYRHGGLRS